MAPNLIGSLAAAGLAAGLAGAGLAWAITIDTEMMLNIKTKTVKIANLLILILLSFQESFW
jgi:hypothetical protein